jgi:hypothetical protein
MSTIYPAYFTPGDMPRPAHIRHITSAPVLAEQSPNGTAGRIWAPAGFGPSDVRPDVRPDARGTCWRESRAGWWMALGDVMQPGDLFRAHDFTPGPVVQGEKGIPFLIPQLLRFQPGEGLVPAVRQIFKDGKWVVANGHHARLIDRLRPLLAVAEGNPRPDSEVFSLAWDLLTVNYHATEHEFAHLHWIDMKIMPRILLGAGGYFELISTLETATAGTAP